MLAWPLPAGRGVGEQRPDRRLALPAALFVVLGVASVAWFEATMAIDPPPRFLLPVFVPLVVAAASVPPRLADAGRGGPGGRRLVTVVVVASLPGLVAFVGRADRKGLLDYSTPAWATSPLLAYLKANPVRGAVASDDPYILDLRLGIPAELTPARTYYASREAAGELGGFVRRAARAAAAGGLSVIWFPRSYQPYLYSLADLEPRSASGSNAISPMATSCGPAPQEPEVSPYDS